MRPDGPAARQGSDTGRFFHGYYRCYCYLPLYIFCGDHRPVLHVSARRTSTRRRVRWPRCRGLSGRSGSAGPGRGSCFAGIRASASDDLMVWCEDNGVDFVFGFLSSSGPRGPVQSPDRAAASALAEPQFSKNGKAARRYCDFRWRTVDSWSRTRRVVAKTEGLPGPRGANPPSSGVTSLGRDRILGPNCPSTARTLYCAAWRRLEKPDQGAAAGPVRRPHLDGNHDLPTSCARCTSRPSPVP